jgi:hypothetical protein
MGIRAPFTSGGRIGCWLPAKLYAHDEILGFMSDEAAKGNKIKGATYIIKNKSS